jgi:hypothetical protein
MNKHFQRLGNEKQSQFLLLNLLQGFYHCQHFIIRCQKIITITAKHFTMT